MSMDRKSAGVIVPAAVLAVTAAIMPAPPSVAMMPPGELRPAQRPAELRFLHGPRIEHRGKFKRSARRS